ncbi:bifunctional diguanylate cyclase/phosphodiesterase [Actinoplanes sp. TRM 88003]|uniref:Bifunctional diguanylate cyclase/phosphodiesterase n=1 Tax=Paractinoplanes aksuensis TaxID=2939490 RepID=A0ABT1E4B3_9ACTN|nr:bifunctional diguanylate cyclase/phosphodiesterase [Actinoplanes aksuensis]MCO8277101.1 bifunctional diguanylate cyclase/phosphodiesterase [Actinoplanes aksuensis]
MIRKRNALALAGVALVLLDAVWLVAGLGHEWAHPVLGWLPLPVISGLAALASLRVVRSERFDPATRRFWRSLTVAGLLFGAATVANAVDAVGGPQPSQRIGPVAMALYLAVMGVVIFALLRLPSWQRTHGDRVRFALDSCVVLVAGAAFVWQFSIRGNQEWVEQSGSTGAVLVIVAVGLVAVVTFLKVAFAGAGWIDRRSLHLLAAGGALSVVFGGLSPFLGDRPYLSSSFAAVPIGALGMILAANQQLHGDGAIRKPRPRRRLSVLPYVAVVALDGLLLSTGGGDPAVRISAALLTVLVMARQVYALRENRRLLSTVDANLSQLRDYQDQLSHQATHDPLTGVGNRALFEQTAELLVATRARLHVALLDMDDFKNVNDRHGHHAGDSLLVLVSRRLRAVTGPQGIVVRLGGDEFAILLRDLDPVHVEEILGRMVTALREPTGAPGRSSASIGVTTARPGDTPVDLLRRADVAMYAAKAAGGDRWQWFDAALDDQAGEAARLTDDLAQALLRDELFLLYQPIVELPSGRRTGVEVLLRWRHPELGLVAPDVFVPLAERSGVIVEIGRWVLENACRQAAVWQHRHGERAPGKVSINVSARQLAEPGFVAEVEDILSRTGVDRTRLLLEVTETAVLEAGAALEAVRELRERGLRVALDDFGTGQSSLSLLLTVPVDVLKVDKSFVSGAAADQAGAVIVEHLIGFTNGLRMEAVAEGVETEDQARRLHAAGYSLAQGYLFGRPVPAAEIEAALLDPAAA